MTRSLLRCASLLLAGALASAQAPQLVQSIPVETGLEDPGLPHAKEVWPEMIRAARRSIDMAEFYLTNGPDRGTSALEPTLTALEEAVAATLAAPAESGRRAG